MLHTPPFLLAQLDLELLEKKMKSVELYMWLCRRFPHAFVEYEEAFEMSETLVSTIENAIQGFDYESMLPLVTPAQVLWCRLHSCLCVPFPCQFLVLWCHLSAIATSKIPGTIR
jgi:hypothetical protein